MLPRQSSERRRRIAPMLSGVALALVLVAGAGPVTATTPTSAVSLTVCTFGGGGNATIPAGNNLVVQFGFSSDTAGHLRDFIAAATTDASIDGSVVPNANRYWSTPTRNGPSIWVTYWRYDVGTLGSGEDVFVAFNVSLAHIVVSSRNAAPGGPFTEGPGDLFASALTCTITGT